MIWYWYFPRKSRLRLGGQIRHRFLLLSFRLLPFLPSSATAITFTISERKPGLSLQPQLYYTCPFFILLPPSPSTKFEIKLLFSFFASPLSPPPPSSGKSFFLHRPGPGNGKFFESEHSLFSPMGEAPLISEDELHKGFSNGFHVKSGEYQEATLVVDDKEYVIGGINDGLESSIAVRVIEKTTGKWSVPTVLGIKPKPCEKVLSLALNGDRILLIKKDAPADDTIWFLEINTKFVRDHRKSFGTEVVAWSKGVIGDAQIPIVISGPSGVGKGTLISKLMEEFPSNFGFSVSHTTRAPRIKEKNGIHYHFTERNIMEKEIMDGKFLEFASVHDNLYGTSIEAVEVVTDSGKRCILDIDVQGARSVRASPLEALFIFIRPPSFTELENRLRARGTETEEQIQKRLRNAKAEIEQGLSSGIFDHILENNDLDECYDNLKKLLGLDGGAETFNESSSPKMEIHLPVNHVLSRVGDKIFINCGIQGLPNESDTEFVLDVSCLKGGAPGRTRGLEVNTKESCLDSKTGMKELS